MFIYYTREVRCHLILFRVARALSWEPAKEADVSLLLEVKCVDGESYVLECNAVKEICMCIYTNCM